VQPPKQRGRRRDPALIEQIKTLTAGRWTQQAIASKLFLCRSTVSNIQRKFEMTPCAPNPSRFTVGCAANPHPTKTSWPPGVSGNPTGSAFQKIPITSKMRRNARRRGMSIPQYLVQLADADFAEDHGKKLCAIHSLERRHA